MDIVTMTGGQALAAQRALQAIGRKPIKIAGAMRVAKVLQELATVVEIVEKRRREILEKWAIKDEGGKLVTDESGNATFADGNHERFNEEYAALMAEEIEIEVLPVPVAALSDIEVEPTTLAPLVAAGLLE